MTAPVMPAVMLTAAETVAVSEEGGRIDLAAGRRSLEYLLGLTVDDPVPPLVEPATEAARMAAVHRYDILDSPPDGAFDRVTAMAARLLRVPIAIVSIVDSDRVWKKFTWTHCPTGSEPPPASQDVPGSPSNAFTGRNWGRASRREP